MRSRRTLTAVVALVLALIAASCGTGIEPAPLGVADASVDRAIADAAVAVDASDASDAAPVDAGIDAEKDAEAGTCDVRLAMPPLVDGTHVPEATPIAYASNPPSSGPHYPVWANFQEFNHPVDDGYLVHAMEHGAVLLLYKCTDDGGACADTVAALRAVRNAIPADPLCDPGIRVRIILAPRPANDVAVAAAAWGNTYRADCVDASSLTAFITAHYAHAPESFCAAGSIF